MQALLEYSRFGPLHMYVFILLSRGQAHVIVCKEIRCQVIKLISKFICSHGGFPPALSVIDCTDGRPLRALKVNETSDRKTFVGGQNPWTFTLEAFMTLHSPGRCLT